MYFTPQQLQGGSKFAHKTRIGNWQEDWENHDTKLKEYMKKKETNQLVINLTQQKYAKSLQKVPQTFSQDGTLKNGDSIMLFNKKTNGFLVFDMSDRITSHDEAYACTTTNKDIGPCARSVLIVTKVEDPENEKSNDDQIIRYGEKIRFESNQFIYNKKLYLHSCQVSPQIYARFSRNQEVCMITKNIYATVWKIVHLDPNKRISTVGEPVMANEPVLIEHCGTSHYLASDTLEYRNDFGTEYEVCVHSYSTNNKSQSLKLEQVGKLTRDQPTKLQYEQNSWILATATDPSFSEPIKSVPKYSSEDLINEIKDKLKSRGTLSIRGLARLFKILDNNGNRQLDINEFEQGLIEHGIGLNQEQLRTVFDYFDKNKNGSIDFDEFLRALRGELNDLRLSLIKKAYMKLDVNCDGKVKLDDIAKIYDVSKNPDVLSGKMSPQEVYKRFMSLWDTQIADGIVTFSEFCDYFQDISASIDTDEYFALMMQNAWKIQI